MSQANKMERILYTEIMLGNYTADEDTVNRLRRKILGKDAKPNKPIAIIAIAPDGTKRRYKSVEKCSCATGINSSSIRNYAKRNTERLVNDDFYGWRFEEDEDDNV